MRIKSMSMAAVLAAVMLTAATTPAQADTGVSNETPGVVQVEVEYTPGSTSVEVCEGNTLSTVGPDGQIMDGAAIRLHIIHVQYLCEQQGEEITDSAYNVVAQLTYNSSTGWMSTMGYANSLPYAEYQLACTYRHEPVSGAPGQWLSCGERTATGTSLTTRGNSWCPVPGTRWHSSALLLTGKGNWLGGDDTWKVAA
ncbi:hypothetical protein [Agromyces sp. NPDC057865]|uniref:hypothetical protein n=1 Tax=Agromyces sp. NPDC057865 TaxID=3346267 RepID=UPI003670C4C9